MAQTRRSPVVPLERPLPISEPRYDHERGRLSGPPNIEVYSLLDVFFIVTALAMSIWLAVLYLLEGVSFRPVGVLYFLGFWLLLTYITLPRLHQVFTRLYLPDYFFGRTRTVEGVLSDPVNLALFGSEWDLHVAMRRAGWVLAEERTVGSAWGMVKATLLGRSYPSAPVSDLYLLGERHDFTYQQEVGGSTHTRHHVRFWKMPPGFALPGGFEAEWLAAGTYDRAVGFSFFTLQFTHRIDENTDAERDYIIDTLRHADPEIGVEVIKEFSTAYHHRNGQGDRIMTDGDLPVVSLQGAAKRSGGATAIMQPRHRPTGTSVIRSRAQARAVAARGAIHGITETVGEQLHGTVDDLQAAWQRASEHHVPPGTIVFTGVIVALQTLLLGSQWVRAGFDPAAEVGASEAVVMLPGGDSLPFATVYVVALIAMFIGVLRRHRWMRIALMMLFTADALTRLFIATSLPGNLQHTLLVGVGISVLGVMAISSDASRWWVMVPRLDPRAQA